jgi:integrase
VSARRGHGEGSLFYDDKRDRWIGTAPRTPDGRRPKVSAKTKTEARDKLRAVMRQYAEGASDLDGRLTVATFLEQWLAETLPAAPKIKSTETLDNAAWAVRKHIIPAIGARKLAALSADDVDDLLRGMAAEGYARNTMMRVRTVLGRALRHAERRGKVVRNVVALVDTPPGPQRQPRSLTVDEASKLLEVAAGHRLAALWITALMLGMRPAELRGLRWSDVDLDAATLQIRQAMRKDGTPIALKTDRSRRALDLPAPVVDALRRHRAQQAAERLAATDWQETGLVFTSRAGTALDPSKVRRELNKLTDTAGLGHWTPYELRHSAASLLSAAGVRLECVADVLGHEGTRMAQVVYRHAVAPTVAAAVAPMEAMFGTQ